MKKIVFGVVLWCSCLGARAEASVDFDLQGNTVRDVIQIIYGSVSKRQFVLSDDVVNDQRLVSFRMSYSDANLREFLRFQGYQVVSKGAVDYVSKIGEQGPDTSEILVYRPQSRDADYLLRICRDFVKGHFFGDGVNVQTPAKVPDAKTQKLVETSDRIVFAGDAANVAKLKSLLVQLDVPVSQVLIDATVFEVSTNQSDGSSIQLIGSILSSHFGVTIGGPVLANSLTLKFGGLTGVLSALASDVRFKTVSHTSVLVKSMARGMMTVGDQVPVLGAVTIAANGLSQQSVNMVQSGVTLTATPTVFGSQIDLDINQQISSFVATSTGVNTSPTLNNRQLTSNFTAHDGDTIIVGGLTQKYGTDTKTGVGFFNHLLNNKQATQTEIVVILRVSLSDSRCVDCSDKTVEKY